MFNTRLRSAFAATAATALALSLSACSALSSDSSSTQASPATDGKIAVAASFYPIAYLAEKIGGDAVSVTSVTPANVEPHDFELSPKDVTNLAHQKVIFYVAGFQPSLDDALAEVSGPTVTDLASAVSLEHHEGVEDGHDHGNSEAATEHSHDEGEAEEHSHEEATEAAGSDTTEAAHDGSEAEHVHADELDPHFWLDPVRMIDAANAVEKALAAADPAHASEFSTNLTNLTGELTTLDEQFTAGLGQCQRTTFVTSHSAFGYLAERYHLTQESISGLDPESEPSPAEIAAIKKVVADTGTTTIFTEELVSPTTAEAVAKETGASTAVLSPLESAPSSGDYTAAMTQNLSQLRAALGCQ